MTRVSMAVLFATAIAVPAIPAGQQQAFRGGIHTVPVYASVVDRTGRLVTNLTKDDFEVLDNGTRQDLTLFANDRQPITIVIMLDRSGSVSQHFPLVRDAAAEFVANLNDTDRARIGSFSNTVQIDPVGFTSDRDELRRILRENLQNAGATPLWNAAAAAMRALAEEPGRRVVLMFTDGHDNPNEPEPDHRNTTFPEVRAQVQSDEVMVYGIGLAEDCGTPLPGIRLPRLEQRRPPPRGGPGRLPGGRIGGRPPRLPIPFPPMPGGRFPGRGDPIPTPPVPPVVSKGESCAGAKPDPALREIAIESGGGYFELRDTQRLGSTFARVADELHRQYLLGFTPALDGKTHTLEVRVKQGDVVVRARKSYVAPPAR